MSRFQNEREILGVVQRWWWQWAARIGLSSYRARTINCVIMPGRDTICKIYNSYAYYNINL